MSRGQLPDIVPPLLGGGFQHLLAQGRIGGYPADNPLLHRAFKEARKLRCPIRGLPGEPFFRPA